MSIERSQFQALPQKQATPASMPAVTWRAVVIGLVLIPLNCYWVIMSEEIWDAGHPTTTPLFFNTVFSLFIVLLINLLLERIIPSMAIHRGDENDSCKISDGQAALRQYDFAQPVNQ